MSACPKCAESLAAGLRFCGRCGRLLEGLDPAELAAPEDPWLGRVVDGRYRVQARLGVGGMGIVYRVEHLHLGKTAAMKVLSPDTAAKPEMVRRFRLEAQSVSKLNHPNIVQTFDFGQADGALYLVMEYIKGEDLSTLLRRDGAWTFARAARFFIQVCSGLTEAHEAGIVHRDLKPENLMVVNRRDDAEHAKVLDFGLAKLRERGPGERAISTGGQVIGTPYYMAPEQVRGEDLDARADIYSLGATLYRVLTGVPPFDAPSPISVLSKHLTDDVVPPRSRAPGQSLPIEADRIVLRAMAKSVDDRYASAAEVQRDLERALAAPVAEPKSVPTVPIRRPAVVARAAGEAPTLPLGSQAARATATAAAAVAATMPAAAVVSSSDAASISSEDDGLDRLRRSDVDDYEWSLRRQRLVRRLVFPLIGLVVAGAAAFVLVKRPWERSDGLEHEPNNTPGYANLLTQGSVRGTIGAPINDRESDVDYFRVPAGKGPRVLHARLEGIPGVDLVLELFDAQGRRIAKSDARGRGLGEWLQPTSIGPTEAYLAVREVWIDGTPPTANALDPYTLTARWGPPQPEWELEPNDFPASATPLPASGRVRGYLGSAEDRDWFSMTPTKTGLIMGTVDAPDGVDIIVFRDEDGKKVVNKRGAGGDEQFALDGEAGKPLYVGIARKLDGKKDPKEQALQGLEDPYELTVNVTDK
ncbi:MAG TPA: protein kinase [Polyangia bacterium]|nr:protein kinase [Polyangia bacterium]